MKKIRESKEKSKQSREVKWKCNKAWKIEVSEKNSQYFEAKELKRLGKSVHKFKREKKSGKC